MEPFYDDPTLEPGEILVLVEWLDSFCEEVKSWGGADVPVFVEAKKRLMDKFELACTVGCVDFLSCRRACNSGSSESWNVTIVQWRMTMDCW